MSAKGPIELMRAVLDSASPVVLLHGPARSGKTSAALAIYKELSAGGPHGPCMLIAPNTQAMADMKRQLLASRAVPVRAASSSVASVAQQQQQRQRQDEGKMPSALAGGTPTSLAQYANTPVADGGGVLMSPRVVSFAGLAGRVLSAGGSTSVMLDSLRRRLLLRRIVGDLKTVKKLGPLSAVADLPGVVVAMDRAIGELKRAAIDPERLAKAVAGSDRDKSHDLLAVYRMYQERLQQANAHDVEGRLWLARDALAGPDGDRIASAAMGGARTIAVDGFTDFTPTQLEILRLLSVRADKLLITLTYADDGRHRLWHWTGRTLQAVREAFAGRLAEVTAEPAGDCPLTPLWRRVFDREPRAITALPDGVHVTAASGPDAMIAAAAVHAKRLLLASPVRPRIAVLARSTETLAPAIERIFRDHQVPVSCPPTALTDQPIVRFVLDVAGMAEPDQAEQFSFDRVLRVIKNSYFQPGELGDFDAATASAAEMVIRHGNVLARRDAYEVAFARLATMAKKSAGDAQEANGDEDDAAVTLGALRLGSPTIERAGAMLNSLFDLAQQAADHYSPVVRSMGPYGQAVSPVSSSVSSSRKESTKEEEEEEEEEATTQGQDAPDTHGRDAHATNTGQATGLAMIVQRLGLRRVACRHRSPELIARDLRALGTLDDALAVLDQPDNVGRFSLGQIADALSAASCPSDRRWSAVDVLDVLDARAIRYDHVILLDLGEGQFPQKYSEGSFIGESQRRAWAARGLVLDSRGDLTAREMLLFYLAVSRADRGLSMSYLDGDSAGRAGAPSPFLLSMLDSFGGLGAVGAAGKLTKIPPGRFIPPPREIASSRDAFNAAVAGLFHDGPGDAACASWAASHAPHALANAAVGLYARWRRWHGDRADEFDGRLSDADLLAILRKRYPGETVFSASQINTFGQCPWRYFGQYVLRLQELAEPARFLEAVDRGQFCHGVLFRLMRALIERHGRPMAMGEIERKELLEALAGAVADEARSVEQRPMAYEGIWKVQRRQMHRDLQEYVLAQHALGPAAPCVANVELAFGMAQSRRGLADPASTTDPAAIDTPAGAIMLRGKIDRIDMLRLDAGPASLVVDYKTGPLPSARDIIEGRSLQLPLYAHAARGLLNLQCVGGSYHRVGGSATAKTERTFAAVAFKGGQWSEDPKHQAALQQAMDCVGRCVQAMSAGEFDVSPTSHCPSYCPFRSVCQFSEARAEVKAISGTDAETPAANESRSQSPKSPSPRSPEARP